jgi:hypothetical protein
VLGISKGIFNTRNSLILSLFLDSLFAYESGLQPDKSSVFAYESSVQPHKSSIFANEPSLQPDESRYV